MMRDRDPWRRDIRRIVLTNGLVFLVLACALISWLALDRFRAHLIRQGLNHAEQYSHAVTSAMMVGESRLLAETTQTLLHFDGLRHLSVHDNDGQLRYESGQRIFTDRVSILAVPTLTNENSHVWHIVAPIKRTRLASRPDQDLDSTEEEVLGFVTLDWEKAPLLSLLGLLLPFNAIVCGGLALYIMVRSKKAENLDRQKIKALRIVTHDLRTPVHAILGSAQVILERLVAYEEKPEQDQVRAIVAGAQHLAGLVEHLSLAQSLASGKPDLMLTTCDLNEAFAISVKANLPLIEMNENRLSQQYSRLTPIRIDQTKLLEISNNLLSNAGKFTRGGRIGFHVWQSEDELIIQVSDTGIGIASQDQSHIFGWFWKAEARELVSSSGSGLGLAIAKGCCDLMGGSLNVKSALGRGSTFTARLPLPIRQDHTRERRASLYKHFLKESK